MGGFFIGGLGDGFAQGFNAVTNWQALQEEKKLQQQQMEENRQHRAELMDLQRQQLGLAQAKQQADVEDSAQRLQLAREGLGLNAGQLDLAKQKQTQDFQNDKARLGIAQQQLGLAQQSSNRENRQQWYAEQEANLKLQAAQRNARLDQANRELVPKLQAGTFDGSDLEKFHQLTGVRVEDLADNQLVDRALALFHGVSTGEVKPDDPRLKPIADKFYGGYMQRGIGEKITPHDGNGQAVGPEITVTGKSWGSAFTTPNGQIGVNLLVTGKDADGNEHKFLAPATKYGTGDREDPVILFTPDDMARPVLGAMAANQEFNQNPAMRQRLMQVLGQGTDAKDMKTQAETEKLRAETQAIKGGGKELESKLGDLRALVNQRYGGKLNMLTDENVGADRNGWDAVLDGAEKLLRANPNMSSVEAFTQARKQYEGGGKDSAPEPPGKFEEGTIYKDAQGQRRIYKDGKFQRLND